ncbi:helix-turn-helix domain-containing protein [Rhizobium sp. NTR19]|uniref:Helix-turn-helix domain-containing protein n=1 Tax=Neorhizobium turbinariae TaxID=2937795 RepID=A0ABT0IXY0_9HYPH|nr:helix-turn-helix domain-containing protein [Neorhizobium turbinariae]MCK8782718.1 helix-turn-helix domain-containing protein [Neorhizobium turbinariae]
MFAPLGDILAAQHGRETGRTVEPVRRHSRAAGRCEGVFWRRTDRQEVRRIVMAARRYELATRQPGTRNGALGPIALEILELFANLIDFRTGRLEPSLDTLMRMLKRSRDAISRALKALREHGFIDWLRRYIATGNKGRGPQLQQTSNAYRLSLPKRALQLLGRYGQSTPEPDDFLHARQSRAAEIEAHRQSLSLAERPLFDMEDGPLARALARLGAGIDKQRESASRSESQSKSIPMRK